MRLTHRPQTLKQAKKAYRKSGAQVRLSESELAIIERRAVLQERADRIRDREARRKANIKKREERNQREREARERMGIPEPEKEGIHVGPSQPRLSDFLAGGQLSKRKREEVEDEKENKAASQESPTSSGADITDMPPLSIKKSPWRNPLQPIAINPNLIRRVPVEDSEKCRSKVDRKSQDGNENVLTGSPYPPIPAKAASRSPAKSAKENQTDDVSHIKDSDTASCQKETSCPTSQVKPTDIPSTITKTTQKSSNTESRTKPPDTSDQCLDEKQRQTQDGRSNPKAMGPPPIPKPIKPQPSTTNSQQRLLSVAPADKSKDRLIEDLVTTGIKTENARWKAQPMAPPLLPKSIRSPFTTATFLQNPPSIVAEGQPTNAIEDDWADCFASSTQIARELSPPQIMQPPLPPQKRASNTLIPPRTTQTPNSLPLSLKDSTEDILNLLSTQDLDFSFGPTQKSQTPFLTPQEDTTIIATEIDLFADISTQDLNCPIELTQVAPVPPPPAVKEDTSSSDFAEDLTEEDLEDIVLEFELESDARSRNTSPNTTKDIKKEKQKHCVSREEGQPHLRAASNPKSEPDTRNLSHHSMAPPPLPPASYIDNNSKEADYNNPSEDDYTHHCSCFACDCFDSKSIKDVEAFKGLYEGDWDSPYDDLLNSDENSFKIHYDDEDGCESENDEGDVYKTEHVDRCKLKHDHKSHSVPNEEMNFDISTQDYHDIDF